MNIRALGLGVALLLASPAALAVQVVSDWGKISILSTGWVVDSMAVTTTAPTVNPGCPVLNAGYATNPADPGRNLHHAVLLAALLNNREVQIIAEGCIFDKPRIISVIVRGGP
jgi:hypothetical protein